MAAGVLIVEDDDANRTLLERVLSEAGYDVVTAATFEAARRLLASRNFDLLITDLRLGGFNGLQLLVRRPLPAIVITGYPDPVLETEAKHLGATFVVKPVTPGALLDIVREKIESQPQVTFDHLRRWVRKPLAGALVARADEAQARVVDVSYGGVRFEVAEEAVLPPSFDLDLPAQHVAVHVNLVWQSRTAEGTFLCGAVLSQADIPTASAWHGFVDSLG